jgi:CRP-like cAMP-binding protein
VYNIFGKLNVQNRAEAALMGARLGEVQRQQMQEAESGRLNLGWLQAEMSHRRMRKGQTIFRLGDVGNALYYLQRGSVRLPEIGATVQPGEVFGEIGVFTPEHKRTCSAVCEADSELFSLSSEQVKRIHFANPQFAFFILHLIATRLMADRKRGN